MPLWHDDDRFWAVVEPNLFSDARKHEAVEEAAQVVKLLGVEPGAHILDHCCGVGRHSVQLAKLGFSVTGVDRTARYLELARAYAAEQGVAPEFLLGDMRSFRRPQAFDGAVNLFTSFGYFEDSQDDLRVLCHLRDSLRPGARLVMQMAGKEVLARIFAPKDWTEHPDGTLFLAEREALAGWSMIRNRWLTVRPDGERIEFNFAHRIYSGAELDALIVKAGLKPLGTYGALDGRPYDQNATALVIVAQAGPAA